MHTRTQWRTVYFCLKNTNLMAEKTGWNPTFLNISICDEFNLWLKKKYIFIYINTTKVRLMIQISSGSLFELLYLLLYPPSMNRIYTFTFMHLADAFIQSDLHCIQVIHVLHVCYLWIEPTTFYAANAMLYHWATGTLLYPEYNSILIIFVNLSWSKIKYYIRNVALKYSN